MWDLSNAVVVSAGAAYGAERMAAVILRDEIARRAGLDWPIAESPVHDRTCIIVTRAEALPAGLTLPGEARPPNGSKEGYTIYLESERAPRLWLVGSSGRGTMFAVGRLLRWLEARPLSAILPFEDSGRLISTSPAFPLRGHQLGYRSVPNTYDAWTVDQFEQYIRELILFGINSIELIPTLDPDEPATEIMPLPPWEMNCRLAALLDAYDLDTWIWLPTTDGDPAKPDDTKRMLAGRAKLFASMRRLDHLFVPGGDPGHVPPEALLPFLAEVAITLRQSHPEAGLWISPQGFTRPQLNYFYRYLQEERPDWLTGVVFGPWVADTIEEIREAVPLHYRLRRYPDIGHCVRCQYPVPEWDPAFALTLGREPINPRPSDQAYIHNRFMGFAEGSLTYSEGVNDDVNKAVWAERLWDPQRPVREILVEYGRAYIGPDAAELVADGLLALEEDWRRPLADNPQPRRTLAIWKQIRENLGEAGKDNWRAQQGYFRAIYDVYVQERLRLEIKQEREALQVLSETMRIGVEAGVRRAREILQTTASTPEIEALRREILDLGEALWRSIGMQMSVPLYHADNPERGAVLDFLDAPLNDRNWILAETEAALRLPDKKQRIEAIERICGWTDPGPGGFYDDLGNSIGEPHLVRGDWARDPGFLRSAQDEFGAEGERNRLTWSRQASTLYGTPLEMRYTGLEKSGKYRLCVVYNGRFKAKMRLVANDDHEVHGPLGGTHPPSTMTFDLPGEVTAGGELRLQWQLVEGRGCQVAEVWLIRL